MPGVGGVNHPGAIRALERAGFVIIRQGKHIVMSDGTRQVTLPRRDPIKALTTGGIVQDAGLIAGVAKATLPASQEGSFRSLL